jgi:hypothetical protein
VTLSFGRASGAGNDRIDGGLGADVMTGGTGNDLHFVDEAGGRVVMPGEGTDAVYTKVSYTLGPTTRSRSFGPTPGRSA